MSRFFGQAYFKARYFVQELLHGAEKVISAIGGSGHPAGIWWGERKIRKGKRLDDILKKAMEYLLEESIELPRGSPALRAVEIVKPFIEQDTNRIDWIGIEADLTRVRKLLALWKEQEDSLEDEEILLMLMI